MRGSKDFSQKTLKTLRARGYEVVGAQAAPAFDGDSTFSGRAYHLVKDGCLMIRSFSQVMEIAA